MSILKIVPYRCILVGSRHVHVCEIIATTNHSNNNQLTTTVRCVKMDNRNDAPEIVGAFVKTKNMCGVDVGHPAIVCDCLTKEYRVTVRVTNGFDYATFTAYLNDALQPTHHIRRSTIESDSHEIVCTYFIARTNVQRSYSPHPVENPPMPVHVPAVSSQQTQNVLAPKHRTHTSIQCALIVLFSAFLVGIIVVSSMSPAFVGTLDRANHLLHIFAQSLIAFVNLVSSVFKN